MLYFDALVLLVAFGMTCYGLSSTARKKLRQMICQVIGVLIFANMALMFWCLLFFHLMSFPLTAARPWALWEFIINSASLTLTANAALWGMPCVLTGFGLVTRISPLLEPTWRHLYGNARFATSAEIKKMGLLGGQGNLLVGDFHGKLLQYQMTNHVLVFAPSRSGKGVSLVIPNALHWPESLLALDNKYEIFQYTSGYRAHCGHRVYRFSPADKSFATHCINPLDYINKHHPSKRITDLHLILDVLIQGSGNDNKMWEEEARSIALGLLLWLMQSDRPFTLGELASIIKGGAELETLLTEIIDEHTLADNLITLDHAAILAIQSFLQKAPKEQSGVRSTLTAMLRLWEDPLICAATSRSDFDFREMRKTPITLYLSFGTAQISRLAPLINIIVQLFLNLMLDSLPSASEPCKVLCLLDEINRFGRMDKLKDGFGDLAGYGVHLMPVIQNVGQFFSTYGGRDNTDIFFQNTDLKVGFRQNAATDKEFLSRELGNKTVRIKNRSYGSNREGSQYSENLIERPLMSPQDIGRLSMKKQLIISGDGLIQCRKIIYYKDKRFKPKLLPPVFIAAITPVYPIISIRKNESPESSTPSAAKAYALADELPQAMDEATRQLIEELAEEFENKQTQ